jgi:hypothetical protein
MSSLRAGLVGDEEGHGERAGTKALGDGGVHRGAALQAFEGEHARGEGLFVHPRGEVPVGLG